MRRLFTAMLLTAALASADGLEVVRAAISDSDGGPPNAASAAYHPGDSLYFTCRVAGFARDASEQVRLTYTVTATDPHGVPLAEPYKNSVSAEVTPQDKDWLPKIEASVNLPSLLFGGEYKMKVQVEDIVAKASASLEVPFKVQGREDIHPVEALEVQAFRFLRKEDDTKAAERAAYVPGDHLWAKFDITGFRYGPSNRIDVSYVTSVLGADGATLWTQREPAGEKSESFYPHAFVPAEMGLELQAKIKPGAYTLVVQAKDAIGNQTCEIRKPFTIQ
ncbi:MAG TPA: hypothetical protein VHW24_21225 [Bryobacteraceae bacterium]|jgi:hypothetical protein|nr:hypothetical protein [Bryobacteraceae bacterium]